MQQVTHIVNFASLRPQRHPLALAVTALCLAAGTQALAQQAPAAPAAEQTMGGVSVTAGRDTATEGSGSYTTGVSNTATKLNLSLRETPQSVSVLTRQQIDDLGITTLDDAVQSITGLVMQKGNFTGDSGSFSARGFPIDNILFDGLPTSLGANGTFNGDNDDLAIYDRIEVVRGATGLTTGSGTPGAAINLVRKRPTAMPQASFSASIGSWSNYRLEADAANALNEAKTLRGRIVATLQDKRDYVDVLHGRNHQLYGIIEADLRPDIALTVGAHYRKTDNDGVTTGVVTAADGSFLNLPRSTYLGTDFDGWRQTDQTIFAELEHRFGNGWKARLAATRKTREIDTTFSGISRRGDTLRFNSQSYRAEVANTSYDAYAGGSYSLFGRQHELTVGASHRRASKNSYGGWAPYSWKESAPVIDPYHWDAGSVARPAIDYAQWRTASITEQSGVYAGTRLRLADPLSLVLGGRLSWYKDDAGYSVAREFTPYAGVVYDLDKQHSVYASWTEIFQPQAATDAKARPLKPISGTNYETGVKGEYFGGALNASAAVFQIRQQNRGVDDLAGPNPCPGSTWGYCQRASGEVRSEGVELDVAGALTPDWQLSAGYTYVKAHFARDSDPANIGKDFNSRYPRQQLKLVTSYHLSGAAQGWRVGASVYGQGATESSDGTYHLRQGRYAIVGLNAAWQVDSRAELHLNVNNALDKHYYQSIYSDVFGNLPGAQRNLMLTLNYKL
ncbi:TonB-dependent siderophore receptor [Janthinobacterium sp. FT14W]|uniref:TonB-dependent siderophore receptor n=1 Tax=Janthinobacterium sp. FT14W TaxID=2654253 RepID=UPI00186B2368|nr:TonB-dependent siderophore receptor [Janthinobacterium sp. FT14W]